MRLGIMQPYIFPYIGYFQLIKSVDCLVIYDDVSFIKQGWINRKRILLNSKDFLFSIPIKDISSYKSIKETLIDSDKYKIWCRKFLNTLNQAYKRARYFDAAYLLVKDILDAEYRNISELSSASFISVCKYLNISTQYVLSSSIYENEALKSQARVLDICKRENADIYINVSGGQSLYSREEFSNHGITLKFIVPGNVEYDQLGDQFVPSLSIIDVLMFNSTDDIKLMLDQFILI